MSDDARRYTLKAYTLQDQLICVRRELVLRKATYPKRMKPATAEHEINCMQAVHDTLTALVEQERESTA